MSAILRAQAAQRLGVALREHRREALERLVQDHELRAEHQRAARARPSCPGRRRPIRPARAAQIRKLGHHGVGAVEPASSSRPPPSFATRAGSSEVLLDREAPRTAAGPPARSRSRAPVAGAAATRLRSAPSNPIVPAHGRSPSGCAASWSCRRRCGRSAPPSPGRNAKARRPAAPRTPAIDDPDALKLEHASDPDHWPMHGRVRQHLGRRADAAGSCRCSTPRPGRRSGRPPPCRARRRPR